MNGAAAFTTATAGQHVDGKQNEEAVDARCNTGK